VLNYLNSCYELLTIMSKVLDYVTFCSVFVVEKGLVCFALLNTFQIIVDIL